MALVSKLQSLVPEALRSQWRFVRKLKPGGQSQPIVLEALVGGTFAVLKLLRQVGEPEARARLAREIAILDSIKHESIVELLAHDSAADPPWYLTPLGEPLEDYWNARRSVLLPSDLFNEAREIIAALLRGLTQFHATGGVHRDIKPGNVIMLRVNGRLKPVLIDFGIAFLPAESRITPTDGRIVANRLVAPPNALYGRLDKPPQWWDCLGIAWLWGWMLMQGQEPKYGRYDARYHRFIQDPRCERVRCLWMAVGVEETSPQNADQMVRLMESIGIGAAQHRSDDGGFDFRNAMEAEQIAHAQALREAAEVQRLVTAAAAPLAIVYDNLLTRMRVECDAAKSQGLSIIYIQPKPALEALGSVTGGASTQLIRLELGRDPKGKVLVEISVRYVPSRRPGFLPLKFCLQASKPFRLLYSLIYYHALDGHIGWVQPGEDEDYPESDDDAGFVERKLIRLVRGPELWSWTAGE